METKIPGGYIDPHGQDFVSPATDCLKAWQLMPTDSADKVSLLGGTPDSIAIIKSGMSDGVKWFTSAGAGTTLVAALLAQFDKLPQELKSGAGIGLPVFASAVVVAIGYVVAQDVRGRAEATNQQLRSRAAVLQGYLALLAQTRMPPVAAEMPTLDEKLRELVVAIAATGSLTSMQASGDGSSGPLSNLRQLDGQPAQVQIGGDWVKLRDVTSVGPS